MRTVAAAIFADFVSAPFGGPSQLGAAVGTGSLLAHTLRRARKIEGLARCALVVRPRDAAAAAAALANAGTRENLELLATDDVPRPRRELLVAARKWNLASWRGGLLGTSWFDEWLAPRACPKVLEHLKADALLCLEGHQPLLDPEIAGRMVATARADDFDEGLVFTQAPPGLAGVVLGRAALHDLVELDIPLGLLLSYRPELAQPDPIIQPGCVHVSEVVAQTAFRLTGDTTRSRQAVHQILEHVGEDPSAEATCRWLAENVTRRLDRLPLEIELELTTVDLLEDTTLHPRGTRVPRRVLEQPEAVGRLARELGELDDRLVVLGGHGDPLQHAQFGPICELLRQNGVYGIAVVTPLVELRPAVLEALFAVPVDVLEVQLDATSAERYCRLHHTDAFDRVVEHIDQIESVRRERRAPRPILVPSITRTGATLDDVDGFYEAWIRRVGSCVIRGYSTYGGCLPPGEIIRTCPPVREPCRRLRSRLMLLADGRAVLCSEDGQGAQVVGDWLAESLAAIWNGDPLQAARLAHSELELARLPRCANCGEWHRP